MSLSPRAMPAPRLRYKVAATVVPLQKLGGRAVEWFVEQRRRSAPLNEASLSSESRFEDERNCANGAWTPLQSHANPEIVDLLGLPAARWALGVLDVVSGAGRESACCYDGTLTARVNRATCACWHTMHLSANRTDLRNGMCVV